MNNINSGYINNANITFYKKDNTNEPEELLTEEIIENESTDTTVDSEEGQNLIFNQLNSLGSFNARLHGLHLQWIAKTENPEPVE